jgi:serine O-acetyltransferase
MSDHWQSDNLTEALTDSILTDDRMQHMAGERLPDRDAVLDVIESLRMLFLPGFFDGDGIAPEELKTHVATTLERVHGTLIAQIARALQYGTSVDAIVECDTKARAVEATESFMQRLPEIRRLLSLDVQAAYDGDPAAIHTDETALCYPGIRAMMVHRIAHELYRLQIPLLPRIMHEAAHGETGIDIHPGATIGESFFVDHGTGVVIGETTVIGDYCKVYQGVTLGARSFEKDERGRLKRGTLRHPTLGDHVTVYAGATILGGDTTIGDHCVIAGGVFLTRSVESGKIVTGPKAKVRTLTNPEHPDFNVIDDATQ